MSALWTEALTTRFAVKLSKPYITGTTTTYLMESFMFTVSIECRGTQRQEYISGILRIASKSQRLKGLKKTLVRSQFFYRLNHSLNMARCIQWFSSLSSISFS